MSETQQYDTRIRIVTPENIAFEHRVAGPFQRAPAYLLDLAIRVGVLLVFWIVLTCSGVFLAVGAAPYLISWFLLDWFYGGLFETYWNGQTPGKRALSLRVVSHDGQPINGLQAFLRNILRTIDGAPYFSWVAVLSGMPSNFALLPTAQLGLLSMMFTDRFQRLGDLACGTMVIMEEPSRLYGMAKVAEPEAIRLAGELPVGFRPSREMALALSNYVQRRNTFPWPRRMEIARHLGEPLRERFGLPPDTSHDLLLCALYHRAFIADEEEPAANPLAPPVEASA